VIVARGWTDTKSTPEAIQRGRAGSHCPSPARRRTPYPRPEASSYGGWTRRCWETRWWPSFPVPARGSGNVAAEWSQGDVITGAGSPRSHCQS
jgi:hypothetical protein